MEEILNSLRKRYAVKQFDSSKKLSNEQVESLKEAVNLTATSLGLQSYRVFVISDQAVRERLKKESYDQAQITTASHLFLFCAHENIDNEYVDKYIDLIAKTRNQSKESLKGYESMVRSFVNENSEEFKKQWAARQAYIAIGNLLTTAALAGIDACPMEGFDAVAYSNILNINDLNLKPYALVALGYKSMDDKYGTLKKVRRSLEEMFIEI